ncbi:MAG: hypothetical protein HYU58_16715 [Proteobacteria bacterium]|nr:hypothetical protein [Pseudomonadota bacterium]
MRPPAKKRIDSETAPAPADSKAEALQEKTKLAQQLHDQGVNPVRWTEAHPAPQSDQAAYQKTGLKAKDNQFEVGGKLYDWSHEVMATPQQAKAIADAYIAERTGKNDAVAPTPKIEELVDIDKVPLKHPFGTPHNEHPANDMSVDEERTALFRHYAQSGVDPDKAHLGDPVFMKDQERLKAQIEKVLPGDKSEISGLPIFYQGFDDGWIYQANAQTRESEAVQKIRAEHAVANENDNNGDAVIDKVVKHYGETLSKGEVPDSTKAIPLYRAAVQNLPEVIAILETLQAGKPLTERQDKIKESIEGTLKKAGIKFDYTLSDPDALRGIYEQAKAELSDMQQDGGNSSGLAMAMLTMRATQAIAGGSFDTVRMMQSESLAKSFLLAAQKYLPIARKVIEPLVTADNVEKAKEGPIDYEAALNEMRGLFANLTSFVTDGEQEQPKPKPQPASPSTLRSLNSGLTDVSNVEIVVGGIPLFKQSEHKTLMDEIFRTEFIKIAQEKGCLPGPEGQQWNSHGGSKAQKRITDVDQTGHLGSRQPDGWVKWLNPDNTWTEVLWNSTSTLADGFTNIAREAAALKDILVKAGKQWAMRSDPEKLVALKDLTNDPVLSEPSIVSMGTKPNWSETELRDYISKKLRDFFDKNFEDCKFVGENREQKLDDPDDPDLPATPPR